MSKKPSHREKYGTLIIIRVLKNISLAACNIAWVTMLLSCSPVEETAPSPPGTEVWPSGLIVPLEGATFSTLPDHSPGAPTGLGEGAKLGFDFFNGYSGRPLTADEVVVAVAEGKIIRIDHDYTEPQAEAKLFWTRLSEQPGFAQEHALDRLHGRQIWIEHDSGHVSRYSHLAAVRTDLSLGQAVAQGDPIGLIGNSGIASESGGSQPEQRLHFQLWKADGAAHLGGGMGPFQTQQMLAAVFGTSAVARGVRNLLAKIDAGESPAISWPPDEQGHAGFEAEVPESVVAGSAFTIPLFWPNTEFLASELIAALGHQTLSVLAIEGGAVVVAAAPVNTENQSATLILGGINQFGRTLLGSRQIHIRPRSIAIEPLQVDSETLGLFSSETFASELNQIAQAALRSLPQIEPEWSHPFAAPIAGDVVGVFGQAMVSENNIEKHKLPGVLVLPVADPLVRASNYGVVLKVAELPVRGQSVMIHHGGGIVSLYSRLKRVDVNEGQRVARGESIGAVSTEGTLADQVLLWEMNVVGMPSDPLEWIGQILPGLELSTGTLP